ncbi:hypothetical protein [Pacificispira sp.]|uniref:hypothetical protein n=1 Tax=Pacificispira sp. TaxID=2888761 RepID=UPI003BAB085C
MKIYLASSWRNEKQPHIVNELRAEGHDVYDFRRPFHTHRGFQWSDIDPNWQAWTAEEYRRHLVTHPQAARGYMNDLRAMEWADCCVLLLPCGRSAHLEAGWFAGRGKPVHILTRDGEEPELMALMATSICIDLDELRGALHGDPIDICDVA